MAFFKHSHTTRLSILYPDSPQREDSLFATWGSHWVSSVSRAQNFLGLNFYERISFSMQIFRYNTISSPITGKVPNFVTQPLKICDWKWYNVREVRIFYAFSSVVQLTLASICFGLSMSCTIVPALPFILETLIRLVKQTENGKTSTFYNSFFILLLV